VREFEKPWWLRDATVCSAWSSSPDTAAGSSTTTSRRQRWLGKKRERVCADSAANVASVSGVAANALKRAMAAARPWVSSAENARISTEPSHAAWVFSGRYSSRTT
jgi:hypothetical protein